MYVFKSCRTVLLTHHNSDMCAVLCFVTTYSSHTILCHALLFELSENHWSLVTDMKELDHAGRVRIVT